MSDLIDRQQAIDAFNTNLNELVVGGEENAKTVENYLNRVLDKIKCLPSALSTNLAEVGTDLISRRQAIDYFVTNVGFHDEDGYPIEDECELREIWTGYFDGIPSAEPQIIRCKECMHRDKYGCCKHWKGLAMGDIPIATDDNDFCSNAER